METLYRRVYINGDPERLPKEGREFIAHDKKNNATYPYCKFNKDFWLEFIDWYYAPVPRSEIIEILNGRGILGTLPELIADEIIGGNNQ